jgi:hypothetical protein
MIDSWIPKGLPDQVELNDHFPCHPFLVKLGGTEGQLKVCAGQDHK